MKSKKRQPSIIPPSKVIDFPMSRRVRPATTGGVHSALVSAINPLLSAVAAAGSAVNALELVADSSNLAAVWAAKFAMNESTEALRAVLNSMVILENQGGEP